MDEPVDPIAPPPPEELPEPRAAFTGLGIRVAAFALDVLALASAGSVVGSIAREPLIAMGRWTQFLGLAAGIAYFGGLGSRWGRGQTLGMRATGIRLVDLEGSALTPARSALRALVFFLPALANGWSLPGMTPGAVALGAVLAALVFGLGPALLAVAIFNRPSRRSLHDLAAGSVVVRASPPDAHPSPCPFPQLALMGASAWMAIVLLAVLLVGVRIGNAAPERALESTWRELGTIPGVASASLLENTTTTLGLGKDGTRRQSTSLVATLWTTASESEVKRISFAGATVVRLDPVASRVDSIVIRVCRGYGLVFWSWSDCSVETEPGRSGDRAGSPAR